MSLQLELLLQFVQVKASNDDLEKLMAKAQAALDRQNELIEANLKTLSDEIYASWISTYSLETKFPIYRISRQGPLHYRIYLENDYCLIVKEAYFELSLLDNERGKCRVCIFYDGGHDGCLRDRCYTFDEITGNRERIAYLLSFIANVHHKLVIAEQQLKAVRLEYP